MIKLRQVTRLLARVYVYGRAPGLVARCQRCGQVVLRLVAPRTQRCWT
ncbi:DUF6510 family protein [Streptomyces sp. MK7]|nr:DUF6510 family protein [Streptomyces sp. MK7]